MQNPALKLWIEEMKDLCQPEHIHWCNGSENEKENLTNQALSTGELIKLNETLMPNSYLHRSNTNDVARVEERTFICTLDKRDAGPTNHWMDPAEAYSLLKPIFKDAMKERTMYVIPFCMGPWNSPFRKIGIQITDSIYVVLNMRMMTRMGQKVLDLLGDSEDFTKGLHATATLNPEQRYIMHFSEDNTIWSVNSGYGGNALLGKKCLALRIASYLGQKEKWMAEHMLILGIQARGEEPKYILAAFPSACGKTNLAMLMPPESFKHKGYKIWTVGDDIAWLHIGKEGELRAINPEYGFFGVLPGTNSETNPQALATMKEGAIYTNVLLKEDKTVWWEDGEGEVPSKGIDWKGLEWTPEKETAGAHPNSRFTAPLTQSPTVSSAIDNPEGVPISAILFGGRRATINPLVYETYSWTHGVYAGATMCSERTAAQEVSTTADDIRHDPMAMQPFCGYNMGDYFKHWIYMGRQLKKKPKIYYVNWFRKGDAGDFLWPGYGDNLRVLEWILNRCRDKSFAQETPIGYVPRSEDLDLSGLSLSSESMEKLFTVNKDRWLEDLRQQESFLMSFGADLPEEIWQEFRSLSKRVKS